MIIGLTGQTGAGKSTVCEFLKKRSFHIIDCDKVAREVTEKGSPLLKTLAENFGEDILFDDGSLNRRLLAEKAFCSEEKTKLLNSLTHPEITRKIEQKIKESQSEFVVLDAPTLIESGAYKMCQKIISVVADEKLRKQRIIARDNLTLSQAEIRIKAQKDDAFYAGYSDCVIYNNADEKSLLEKVKRALCEIGVVENE